MIFKDLNYTYNHNDTSFKDYINNILFLYNDFTLKYQNDFTTKSIENIARKYYLDFRIFNKLENENMIDLSNFTTKHNDIEDVTETNTNTLNTNESGMDQTSSKIDNVNQNYIGYNSGSNNMASGVLNLNDDNYVGNNNVFQNNSLLQQNSGNNIINYGKKIENNDNLKRVYQKKYENNDTNIQTNLALIKEMETNLNQNIYNELDNLFINYYYGVS